MIPVVLLMFGSFVLGLGSFAVVADGFRARLSRWQGELEHREWAVHLREEKGQLLPDPPTPAERWGMAGAGAAEPVGTPERVAVRAAWEWQNAEPVGGDGWLNGPVNAFGRWLAALLFEGLMLAAALAHGVWLLAWRGLRALAGWLARPEGWLGRAGPSVWRALEVAGQASYAYPPPVRRGPAHKLRRGRKPLQRFLDDIKTREKERQAVAYQARLRAVALDVWLSPDKDVPYEALSAEEQERRFEESLEEVLAYSELVKSSHG